MCERERERERERGECVCEGVAQKSDNNSLPFLSVVVREAAEVADMSIATA